MKAKSATFRRKLMLTLLGFVLLAELVVALAILRATYDQTIAEARDSLRVGERVLDRLMALRGDQLLSTVDILASDFGFKSAVATEDGPTLRTVLANFGDRVNADMAILAEPSGQITATVPRYSANTDIALPFDSLLAKARRTGKASGLVLTNDRAYQFVLVPVKAPRLIAWTGMGFQVDNALAQNLAGLTGLEVEFIVYQDDNELFRTGTLARASNRDEPEANDVEFMTNRHTLLDAGDIHLDAVLALERNEVLAAYYDLARSLILVFLVTLLLSAVVAFWLSRKISQPVFELSRFAESVAAGEYSETPHTREIRELEVLANTLQEMQTAVRHREDRLRHQALHDPLTDLPNRESIRESLQQYFEEKRRFAAVRIAVHGFSRINSAIGHQLGDQVLQTIAERLRAGFGAQMLGRTEGNDFMVLIESGADEAILSDAIEQVRRRTEQPIHLLNAPISLALEIGVVLVPQQASDTEAVWRRTVIARDRARENNGRTFFYQPGMDEARMRELTIIRDLGPALERNELHLCYQPKMALRNGEVRQMEALSRWVHPELGSIGPDEFVGLAERTGQINLLTRWIVRQLTVQLREWRAAGLELGVALNLSADELANEHLAETITPLLDAAADGQTVTLEVTESALLRDPTKALANLSRLQALGARIAVDDFGTGYSSLAQLKQLSADELKIDKSLVLHLDTTPKDQFIVRMIIDLGHKLGMEVVAEGIENAATWRYLVELGADYMQGYFLARPMAVDTLPDWLHNHLGDQAQWTAKTIMGEGGQSPWRQLNS